MKHFTETQKKWAMTSCLVLALGFSISIHKHHDVDGIANLASEAVEGDVATNDGKVKVKYVKDGDQTLAIVKKYNTEGKICEACGMQTFSLSTAFNADDILDMNVALLKKISTDATAADAPTKDEKATANDDIEKLSPKEKADKAFEAIESVCDKEDEGKDQLDCYSTNFKSLLKGSPESEVARILKKEDSIDVKKDKDLQKIDKGQASNFYKSHIANLVSDQVAEAKKIFLLSLKAKAGDAQAKEELDSVDNTDYASIRSDALASVKDLLGDLPKGYSKVRDMIITSQKSLIYADATEFQQSLTQAAPTTPAELQQQILENRGNQDSLINLMDTVVKNSRDGLNTAQSNHLLDGSTNVSTYMDLLNNYAKLIKDGMTLGNAKTFALPTPDGILGTDGSNGRVALTGNQAYANSGDSAIETHTTPGIYSSASTPLTATDIAIINANRQALGMPGR